MRPDISPEDQDIIELLEALGSIKARYPEQLLEKRRAAFLRQLEEQDLPATESNPVGRDVTAAAWFGAVKSAEPAYPSALLAARRLTFQRQVSEAQRPMRLRSMQSAVRDWFAALAAQPSPLKALRGSLIVVAMALAVVTAVLMRGNGAQPSGAPVRPVLATTTAEIKAVICKPGYTPPLCLAAEFDKSRDLTYAGNGSARPAVAKDTVSELHQPANVNDGLYGPGASWISSSPNSWIKIDLGKPTTINTVAFGKDRLGQFSARNPGRFVISVAMVDDVYANGNSSNDEIEYKPVYDSQQVGFDGTITGSATILAQFPSQAARYVKITFENQGTTIDEVEVFMAGPVNNSTRTREAGVPSQTATFLPTGTSIPADTATLLPTGTSIPADTATPVPSATSLPTNTATPVPTATPLPTSTSTPVPTITPLPTDTRTSVPTFTPLPTSTPVPLVLVTGTP